MAKQLKPGELGIKVSLPRLAVTKLKKKLTDIAAIPKLVFAQGRIENLLLKRTKERFNPLGSSKNAQKDPSGRMWKPLSANTHKSGFGPILVRSGSLKEAIQLVRSNLRSDVALSSPTGAKARIGIPATHPAAEYARIHQFGGMSGRGNKVHIPKRRYLGIGSADITAVGRLVGRVAAQQVLK